MPFFEGEVVTLTVFTPQPSLSGCKAVVITEKEDDTLILLIADRKWRGGRVVSTPYNSVVKRKKSGF